MHRPAPFTSSWLPVLALTATLSAQEPAVLAACSPGSASAVTGRARGEPAIAPDEAWRLPIHTLAADSVGGAYGWWTSGASYKASFHDGFAFYPYLGADYPANLPLRWTTEAVRAGDQSLADLRERPVHHHTDWRYEYRWPGITEAYDVRADGVEQLFVITAKPAQPGDLVVVGRVATQLRSAAVLAGAHGELTFCDAAERPLVRYGAAFATDAGGRRLAISTSFDGARVRLTVPGDWLAEATWPVTIDPLTSRVSISFNGRPDFTAIHREDESATNNVLIAYARQFSATDYDLYARLATDALDSTVQVFSDITTSWGTVFPDITFVGGADRWVLAFWRHFSTGETRVRAYFHDKGNTALNGGVVAFHDPVATEHDSFPAVGGSSNPSSGTTALMTYRADSFYGNSDRSVIWGVLLNAAARTIGSNRFQISPANLDAEAPDVNSQRGWFDDAWIVVYEGRNWNSSVDDYDVYAARITTSGALVGSRFVGPDPGGDKVRPVVEGWDGRYLVAMLADPAPEQGGLRWARNVWIERFDWTSSQTFPTKYGPRQVVANANQDVSNLRLAFDGISFSHWCLVYQADSLPSPRCHVTRFGHSGGVTESAVLNGGAYGRYHPSVAWNARDREFAIVYCSTEAGEPVCGQRLQYPANAVNVPYGAACGNTPTSVTADAPLAGSEFFTMRFTGRPSGTVSVLLLSLGPAAMPLDGLGMTGCVLRVSPLTGLFLFSVPIVTNASGAQFQLELPDQPVFQSDVFAQWVWVQPGLNPAGLGATYGLRMQVR